MTGARGFHEFNVNVRSSGVNSYKQLDERDISFKFKQSTGFKVIKIGQRAVDQNGILSD